MPGSLDEVFLLRMDGETLELVCDVPSAPPEWVMLKFEQCPHCPLTPDESPLCPAAVAIMQLVERCEELVSFDVVRVQVITEERTVIKDTTAQRAVSSLMGLSIAASGCPHTRFFKPMARFHLPFSSHEETIYRVTSSYLLGQFFLRQKGQEADMELKGLEKRYEDVQVVNARMAERLRSLTGEDASVNALALLDSLARLVPITINESLVELEGLFESFLE